MKKSTFHVLICEAQPDFASTHTSPEVERCSMKKFIMRLCLRYAAPCGVTDEKLNLYANQPLRDLLGIPRCVDSKELLATKLSQAMTVFQTQEKQARDQQLLLSILNVLPYGIEKKIQPYLFDFFPLLNAKGQCFGTFCYARPFPFFSFLECVDNKLPRLATVQQPNKVFTAKEWEIIFFLLNRLGKKEIAKRLNKSPRTTWLMCYKLMYNIEMIY